MAEKPDWAGFARIRDDILIRTFNIPCLITKSVGWKICFFNIIFETWLKFCHFCYKTQCICKVKQLWLKKENGYFKAAAEDVSTVTVSKSNIDEKLSESSNDSSSIRKQYSEEGQRSKAVNKLLLLFKRVFIWSVTIRKHFLFCATLFQFFYRGKPALTDTLQLFCISRVFMNPLFLISFHYSPM